MAVALSTVPFERYALNPDRLNDFIPAFHTARLFLYRQTRVDVGKVAAAALLTYTLLNSVRYLWKEARNGFWSLGSCFMTQVNIPQTDPLYRQFNMWLAKNVAPSNNRVLTASTLRGRAPPSMFSLLGPTAGRSIWGAMGGAYASPPPQKRSWEADEEQDKKKILLKPGDNGVSYFGHKGKFFFMKTIVTKDAPSERVATEKTTINISCLGWSSAPLQSLLEEVSSFSNDVANPFTQVYTAHSSHWKESASRPARPLSTVDLESSVKKDLIDDVTKYLASRQFYSNRGIPYRRGYLLYGPPGTGKTSLSSAIAGDFKLDLYCVSLSEKGMNDTTLGYLFTDLPDRCVVLMEDIDAAQVSQQRRSQDEDLADDDEDEDPVEQSQTTARASASHSDASSTLTLSGLLNVIDGVASAEGRILIMTTNHRENLDKALIRPGRIDKQLYMGYVTPAVAKAIFLRMYTQSPDEAETSAAKMNQVEDLGKLKRRNSPRHRETVNATIDSEPFSRPQRTNCNRPGTPGTPASPISPFMLRRESSELEHNTTEDDDRAVSQLQAFAMTFARKIPADSLSPAEVQGFLLRYRDDPMTALTSCDQWVKEMLAKKKRRERQGTVRNAVRLDQGASEPPPTIERPVRPIRPIRSPGRGGQRSREGGPSSGWGFGSGVSFVSPDREEIGALRRGRQLRRALIQGLLEEGPTTSNPEEDESNEIEDTGEAEEGETVTVEEAEDEGGKEEAGEKEEDEDEDKNTGETNNEKYKARSPDSQERGEWSQAATQFEQPVQT